MTVSGADQAQLFPVIGGTGWRTDCSEADALYVGDLYTACALIQAYDGRLKSSNVPSTNSQTDNVYDACGNRVGGGTSSGWYTASTPGILQTPASISSTIKRVPPYTPVACLGWWTVVYSWTQTFKDGKTLTATSTGTFYVSPMQAFAPYGGETEGGGNPAELPCQGCSGDPVNTGTGEYWDSTTDLAIGGRGPGLELTRTYSSTSSSGAWFHSYQMTLSLASLAEVTVINANGSQTTFRRNPLGGAYIAPPRVLATLVKQADGTWTYTVRARTVYKFNSSGKLTSIADLNGNKTTLAYNGSGQLQTATDGAGRSFTFNYNTAGQLTSVNDSTGRSVSYGYSAAGDLTSVTDVRGGIWRYSYDSRHLLLTRKDANGNTVMTNTYGAGNRVATQTDGANNTTTYSYSASLGPTLTTTVTNPRGYVTTYDYTGGLLTKTVRAAGTPSSATWTYAYDPYVLGMSSVSDPNGHTTSATYDHQGNQTSTRSHLGRTTSSIYDSLNDLTSHTDGNGVTTTYTYDSRGNPLSSSTPLLGSTPAQNQTVTYSYADTSHPGDLTALTDPRGKTTSFTYNDAGDLTSVTNAAGDKTTYTYDSLGRPQTMVSPRGNASGADPTQYTTRYTYNAAGELLTRTDPRGHQTSLTYEPNGNLSTATDPKLNETTYTYNAADQLVKTRRADGTILQAEYDRNGNLASQTDGAIPGHTTGYSYDALDQLASVSDPLSRTTTYSHDAVGNLKASTDPLSRTTTYSHDADNQLTNVAHSDGTTPNVSFGYDSDGRRTSMTDGTGSWTYTYDSLGRLTKTVNGRGDTVSFGYDLANNKTSITYPNGKTVTRTFDDAGRMATLTDWLGNTTSFGYDPDSNLRTVAFPAATSNVDTYTYNTADQVTRIAMARDSTILASLDYERDGNGQVTSETPSGLPGGAQTYGYDKLNQLTQAGTSSYAYDAADNPTTIASIGGFGYDSANQLTQGPAGTYSYNPLGERTASNGGATTYGYDQAGRLTSTSGTGTAAYTYGGDGLRASKVRGGTTSYFNWDQSGQLPLLLSDGEANYIYGPHGRPLEQIDASGNVLYVHQDQLGSTRLLTDSSGAVAAAYSYDAYGNTTAHTGSASAPLQFQGQYLDSESGLYYLRARYYDPTTAQFITRDPLQLLTGRPYTYAENSPLNFVDPTGLSIGIPGTSWDAIGNVLDDGVDAIGDGLEGGGNAVAGAADTLTFGGSTSALNFISIHPDRGSALFLGGQGAALAAEFCIPFGGEVAGAINTARAARAAAKGAGGGIYIIRGARGTYVGQSGNIPGRLGQHVRSGRFTQAEVDAAERIGVSGGRTAREIAEQRKIDELGGIGGLLNNRNPIGPRRFDLMGEGYMR